MKNGQSLSVAIALPPFVQPNSPYPSLTHLPPFLKAQGFQAVPLDLSLAVLLRIFSRDGLKRLFESVDPNSYKKKEDKRLFALANSYISVIDLVVAFLQAPDITIAYRFVQEDFLPRGPLFYRQLDESRAFGNLGVVDKAKYYCSLFLDELVFFIQRNLDPNFGFSRYAEQIAQSPSTFSKIRAALGAKPTIIDELMMEVFNAELRRINPDVLGISVPFAGNFLAALKLASLFKQIYPQRKVIMGGGYVNTELRSVKEEELFDYVDFITLDDGEMPLNYILQYLSSDRPKEKFVRTFICKNNRVHYINNGEEQILAHNSLTPPSTVELPVEEYFSLTEVLNPMHRLWSDGFWHKITLAHGCYWHKCTFCDVSLDYIKRYSPAKAGTIVDWMENLINETGIHAFHFTDEAAPPALLKRVAIEILRRNLQVVWWGNIRFDKQFTADVCRLLAASGCVAVSGGLEVAEKRLLKMVNKGVSLEQGIEVCHNFTDADVLVHTYLMYGFPTQTARETMNSLELVRQMFRHGLIQSAYWHLFTLTVHSPIANNPEDFSIKILGSMDNPLANNDLRHEDLCGDEASQFGEGLRKSLYNFMHGIGLDWDVRDWFEQRVPQPTIGENYVAQILKKVHKKQKIYDSQRAIWIGGPMQVQNSQSYLTIHTPSLEGHWEIKSMVKDWLLERLQAALPNQNNSENFAEWVATFPGTPQDFSRFLQSEIFMELREMGLLFI